MAFWLYQSVPPGDQVLYLPGALFGFEAIAGFSFTDAVAWAIAEADSLALPAPTLPPGNVTLAHHARRVEMV